MEGLGDCGLRIKGTKNLSDLCVSAVKKGDRRGAEGAEGADRLGEDLNELPPTRPPERLAKASWALPNTDIASNEIAEMTTSDRVQILTLAVTLALTFFINSELKNFIGTADLTN